jgi:predicted 2-oxoglutarate/Fe(II)-dependent dioxygenase YbiX
MEKNIENYLKIYKNSISKNDCKNIVDHISKNNWETHSYYNPTDKKKYSSDQEFEMSYSFGDLENKIMDVVWQSFFKYVKDLNLPWFSGWSGYSHIRFNKYQEQTRMLEHCDHIHSLFDGEKKGIPVLSALGILNDDYEGGELVFWEDTLIEVEPGDILIWPSNFLYPHRVDPVTKGTRHSFVTWAW